MKYYIRAKQGPSRFFLTTEKSSNVPPAIGYLYDTIQGIFVEAGQEMFKWGYWEEASGEIEINAQV